MELLARDNLKDILGYLSDKELYAFSASSKTGSRLAEIEWQKRYHRIVTKDCDEADPNQLFYWCLKYKNFIHQAYRHEIDFIQGSSESMSEPTKQKFKVVRLCALLGQYPQLKTLTTYKSFLSNLFEMLQTFWLDLDFEMYEFARNNMEKLFPYQYEKILIEDLFSDQAVYLSGEDEMDL